MYCRQTRHWYLVTKDKDYILLTTLSKYCQGVKCHRRNDDWSLGHGWRTTLTARWPIYKSLWNSANVKIEQWISHTRTGREIYNDILSTDFQQLLVVISVKTCDYDAGGPGSNPTILSLFSFFKLIFATFFLRFLKTLLCIRNQ